MNDSKSPQVSRTLLTILADLDNAGVWMVSIWPLISKSSRPFNKLKWVVLHAPIFFFWGGYYIHLLLSFFFFSSLARYFLAVTYRERKVKTKDTEKRDKSTNRQVLFFAFVDDLVCKPGALFVSHNSREMCVPHSPRRIPGCNLRSSLLRCGTSPIEWGTEWDSNSLLQDC